MRTGDVLARRVCLADTPGARELRLLARDVVGCDDGLWLDGCTEIDTFGMRVAIDVLFLDDQGRVIAAHFEVPPNVHLIRCDRATSVIQLGTGTARDVRHGDLLELA